MSAKRRRQEPAAGDPDPTEAFERALDVIRRCNTDHGFLASPADRDNYRRVWGRDGCITGLAALLTHDTELREGCRLTLEELATNQGPHGEIPSNVDARTGRVSYGGTTGRVDADLWFVIGCGEYWHRTRDEGFLSRMLDPLERVRRLLGAWEFNNRGLLYVPPTGDWADEYLQSGYVLLDQLLYFEAQRQFCRIHRHLHGSDDHQLDDKVARLREMIRANFWFREDDEDGPGIYHRVLYEKGRQAVPHREGQFWMPFFTPFGYGYRFDALANTFASLLGVADEDQNAAVDDYIDSAIDIGDWAMLPAFWPVVTPKDEKWDDLQATYTHKFKNEPYEYHNGGLWPMIAGFYVASLARRGLRDRARRYLNGLNRANSLAMDGEPWSFPEYVHGRKHVPEGTHPMGWSAAATVIAERCIAGERLFTSTAE